MNKQITGSFPMVPDEYLESDTPPPYPTDTMIIFEQEQMLPKDYKFLENMNVKKDFVTDIFNSIKSTMLSYGDILSEISNIKDLSKQMEKVTEIYDSLTKTAKDLNIIRKYQNLEKLLYILKEQNSERRDLIKALDDLYTGTKEKIDSIMSS